MVPSRIVAGTSVLTVYVHVSLAWATAGNARVQVSSTGSASVIAAVAVSESRRILDLIVDNMFRWG
jgi:hypothetical protein